MEPLLYQYRMEFNFQSSKRHGTQNQQDLERTVTISNDDATVITLHNSTQEGGGGNVDVDRHLRTYRSFCTKICAGYARGRCLALKCKGYRQSRRTNDVSKPSLRPTTTSTATWIVLFIHRLWQSKKSEMNHLLTNIQHEVGPRCQSLLKAPRNMTCYNTDDCWTTML